jgi:gluconate 5-dehydrogenase
VILNGRDKTKLSAAVTELRAEGHAADGLAFDVTDLSAVESSVARIENTYGPLDILVNNAGIQRRAPLEDYDAGTWRELMEINLDSVFYVGQTVARRMIQRRGGKIINICSLMSEAARYSIAPYTASKGAVKMLTKGMCTDWARYNIQVNGIGPGYFGAPTGPATISRSTASGRAISRRRSTRR